MTFKIIPKSKAQVVGWAKAYPLASKAFKEGCSAVMVQVTGIDEGATDSLGQPQTGKAELIGKIMALAQVFSDSITDQSQVLTPAQWVSVFTRKNSATKTVNVFLTGIGMTVFLEPQELSVSQLLQTHQLMQAAGREYGLWH